MSESGDKLARTRLAIIEHIHQKKEGKREGGLLQRRQPALESDPESTAPAVHRSRAMTRIHDIGEAGRQWWRHHPAHTALDLATPALSAYARRRPARFLGVAVVVGALFVLTRPWRLLSVTGLAMSLIKSSSLPSVVMSAISAAGYGEAAGDGTDPSAEAY